MAGVPIFTELAALNDSSLHGEALEEYARVMQPVDPIYYVGHATPSALLFQFGTQDQAFSQEQLERLAEAGSEPKLVRRYETDHMFSNGEGLVDRREWLLAMMLTS